MRSAFGGMPPSGGRTPFGAQQPFAAQQAFAAQQPFGAQQAFAAQPAFGALPIDFFVNLEARLVALEEATGEAAGEAAGGGAGGAAAAPATTFPPAYIRPPPPPPPASPPTPVYLVVSHDYGKRSVDLDIAVLRAVTTDPLAARAAFKECAARVIGRTVTHELLECCSTESCSLGMRLDLLDQRPSERGVRVLETTTHLHDSRWGGRPGP